MPDVDQNKINIVGEYIKDKLSLADIAYKRDDKIKCVRFKIFSNHCFYHAFISYSILELSEQDILSLLNKHNLTDLLEEDKVVALTDKGVKKALMNK